MPEITPAQFDNNQYVGEREFRRMLKKSHGLGEAQFKQMLGLGVFPQIFTVRGSPQRWWLRSEALTWIANLSPLG